MVQEPLGISGGLWVVEKIPGNKLLCSERAQASGHWQQTLLVDHHVCITKSQAVLFQRHQTLLKLSF